MERHRRRADEGERHAAAFESGNDDLEQCVVLSRHGPATAGDPIGVRGR